MAHHPADLYLSLHDDGSAVAGTPASRRLVALLFAVLLLAAAPLAWFTSDAVAATGSKVTLAQDDDDDNSGPGAGDDDDDDSDDTRTGTRSKTATNAGDTGASTKQGTATQSNTATRTGKTGASTKQPTGT
jgi:cytoskeletal protein RodZ